MWPDGGPGKEAQCLGNLHFWGQFLTADICTSETLCYTFDSFMVLSPERAEKGRVVSMKASFIPEYRGPEWFWRTWRSQEPSNSKCACSLEEITLSGVSNIFYKQFLKSNTKSIMSSLVRKTDNMNKSQKKQQIKYIS